VFFFRVRKSSGNFYGNFLTFLGESKGALCARVRAKTARVQSYERKNHFVASNHALFVCSVLIASSECG
jgi:hypothetical protein